MLVLAKADLIDDRAPRRARPPPPRRGAGLRPHGRGDSSADRATGTSSSATWRRSSCSSPTSTADGWPSCTSWPATSSARTRLRACACSCACRRASPRASRRSRSGASRRRMTLRVVRLDPRATLPTRAHPGDAGLDLYALEAATLEPGERASVQPGSRSRSRPAWRDWCCPRSGLAARHGISLVNAPGLIDSGYRGELACCCSTPTAPKPSRSPPATGSRSCWSDRSRDAGRGRSLSDSARGTGGFGSSGGFMTSPRPVLRGRRGITPCVSRNWWATVAGS